jgi:aminoglycoside N3'-acetyltransferase
VSALVSQLRALGVQPGSVLLAHTSFREVGPLDGGPDELIDALLEAIGPNGTLVMPSWTNEDDELFDPSSTSTREHLGIVSELFRKRRGVLRGEHPFAVAAIGPQAGFITSAPFVLPPHAKDSGVARVHDLDGWVLLLGVDHDSNTTIHLAELTAGVPYWQVNYITVLVDGRPKRVFYGENDSCCLRFNLADVWLRERGLQREGEVGNSQAKLVRSRDVVDTVVDELRDDLTRFLHPRGSDCDDCEEAWVSVVESAAR